MKKPRCGFTIVEAAIVVSLLTTLFMMTYTPLASSLAQTQREASVLTMDLSSKRSFSRVSSVLGHALLP